jgi:hypothetical protein
VFAVDTLPPGERMGIALAKGERGRVRYSIISGDDGSNFKAAVERFGHFSYLRLRVRPSFDVTLNRELRVCAVCTFVM